MTGKPDAASPYDAFYFYYLEQLQAIRSGKWKLYLPLEKKWTNFRRAEKRFAAELYDLDSDLGEKRNLADAHPQIVKRLRKFAQRARVDLGDEHQAGENQRPAGYVAHPQPQLLR